jgi:RNA polymerase sigma-70 factor, ECF subfamily
MRVDDDIPAPPGPREPSDDALCRAFLAGDIDAFGRLVRRHQELVYLVARRYCRQSDEAFDLSQRAFLQAFEAARHSWRRFLPVGAAIPFRAWLLRLTINLGKNQLRAGRARAAHPLESVTAPMPGPNAAETLEAVQQQRAVRAAVLELPARQREVFTLRIDSGLSFDDIGGVLGIQPGNARAAFHLAVKRLKVLVELGENGEAGDSPDALMKRGGS